MSAPIWWFYGGRGKSCIGGERLDICKICGAESGDRDLCQKCEAAIAIQTMVDEYQQYAEERKVG